MKIHTRPRDIIVDYIYIVYGNRLIGGVIQILILNNSGDMGSDHHRRRAYIGKRTALDGPIAESGIEVDSRRPEVGEIAVFDINFFGVFNLYRTGQNVISHVFGIESAYAVMVCLVLHIPVFRKTEPPGIFNGKALDDNILRARHPVRTCDFENAVGIRNSYSGFFHILVCARHIVKTRFRLAVIKFARRVEKFFGVLENNVQRIADLILVIPSVKEKITFPIGKIQNRFRAVLRDAFRLQDRLRPFHI